VRNALPDRIQELLDRVGGSVRDDGDRPGPWFDLQGSMGEHVFHDRGETGATRVPSDDLARIGPAAPSISAPAVEERASADVVARHFEVDGDFNRHMDHYNSQALSAHPDWFML
jgi:hypothetical protein